MNILILCNKSPYPAREGGPIAMNMIIEGLISAGHHVRVLAMNTNKYSVNPIDIPYEYKEKTRIELVYVDLSFHPVKAFINLFTGRSYHVERFISGAFALKLKDILREEEFDVIQFEMTFMSPYLELVRQNSKAKTVLRAHNIEHMIWERISETTTNPLKRLYLQHLARTLKKHELTVINDFDGVAAITKNDADFFIQAGCRVPIIDIPFGINLTRFPELRQETKDTTLFSIGAMNWIPNEEGIRWFLETVWPDVTKQFPFLKYFIAGREMPAWLNDSHHPNVEIAGEVDDALKFINEHSVMIVPLFSGSGIRIKIIEGMACGKTIISTTVGAEGIHYTNLEDILIADEPDAFIQMISACMNDKVFLNRIGYNARELIKKDYDRTLIIQKLLGFYQIIGS
jgi:glycosyltransferase involved in cell wall biosynthesis